VRIEVAGDDVRALVAQAADSREPMPEAPPVTIPKTWVARPRGP
jgi:hypothetical protein